MNKKIFIKFIIFVSLFSIMFIYLGEIFLSKGQTTNNFRQEAIYKLSKDSIDIAFLGSSTMQCAILSLEAYHNTGIKTLSIATSSENIIITYYKLKELYKYQSPRVIVVDLYLCTGCTEMNLEEIESAHFSTDLLRLNFNKIMAVKNLNLNVEKTMEHIFPTFCYHTNWKKIVKDVNEYSILENTESILVENVAAIKFSKKKDEKTNLDEIKRYKLPLYYKDKQNLKMYYYEEISPYLDKIIKLAEKNNSKIIFTCIPKIKWEYEMRNFEIIRKVHKGNPNVKFLNLAKEMDNIDIDNDYADNTHLNYLGAQKLTKYIMEYLQENYEFEKNGVDKEIWDASYNEYLEIFKRENGSNKDSEIGTFESIYKEYF